MLPHSLLCPVDLKIDADWPRIQQIYSKIVEMKNQQLFSVYRDDAYFSEVHSLGILGGSLMSSQQGVKADWDVWLGDFLEKFLPQNVLELKKEMIDSGLNFINFGYAIHVGPIAQHTDNKKPGDADDGHCNINYIVSTTDPEANTVSIKDGYTESYPSTPGSCWLLDTAVPHEIFNQGHREVFQIKVYNSYQTVRQFFAERNMLIE